jgi:hypothetical protein
MSVVAVMAKNALWAGCFVGRERLKSDRRGVTRAMIIANKHNGDVRARVLWNIVKAAYCQ